MHQAIVNNRKAVVSKLDALIWELNRQKESFSSLSSSVRLDTGMVMVRTAELVEANTNLSMSIARNAT